MNRKTKENIARLFTKEQIATIPNLLSLLRLLMIPVIVWLYLGNQNSSAAVVMIVISAITDVADGIIARKYNMVSDFGKIFDPVADKLTQAALLICLLLRYPLMLLLIACFAVKEIFTLYMGYQALKREQVHCAKWYGKVNTVTLYAICILLILFPGLSISAANCIILIGTVTSVLAMVLYARFYKKEGFKSRSNTKKES